MRLICLSEPDPLSLLCVKHFILHEASPMDPQLVQSSQNWNAINLDAGHLCCLLWSAERCYFSKTNYCLCIYTSSLRPFLSLWSWPSCYGSPAGHLTPARLYYFCVVWSKMAACGPAQTAVWFPAVKRASRAWQQAACSGRSPVEREPVMPASCVKLR